MKRCDIKGAANLAMILCQLHCNVFFAVTFESRFFISAYFESSIPFTVSMLWDLVHNT